jgi:LytR cell envelope-related transcriptional attenuator
VTSLRESPIRRQQPRRPRWLVVVLIAVAALVIVGVGLGVMSLIRSDATDPSAAASSPAASPCVTSLVTPSEALPKPDRVKINVYNATTTPGLASKTATAVAARGFHVRNVDNDPVGRTITGVGEIRFGPKGASGADLMLIYVPGATLVQLDRKGRTVDLAVGDGFTSLAPEEAVAAAMASPSPVASGPGCKPSPQAGTDASASP